MRLWTLIIGCPPAIFVTVDCAREVSQLLLLVYFIDTWQTTFISRPVAPSAAKKQLEIIRNWAQFGIWPNVWIAVNRPIRRHIIVENGTAAENYLDKANLMAFLFWWNQISHWVWYWWSVLQFIMPHSDTPSGIYKISHTGTSSVSDMGWLATWLVTLMLLLANHPR